MSNIYDQIPVPEYLGKGEGSLEEYLEIEHEAPKRSRRHTVKQFAMNVLHSREYRESILRRIEDDSLPAQVETLLYAYAYGKPVERVEFNDITKSNLEAKSDEELDKEIADLQRARKLREQQLNLNELATSSTQH